MSEWILPVTGIIAIILAVLGLKAYAAPKVDIASKLIVGVAWACVVIVPCWLPVDFAMAAPGSANAGDALAPLSSNGNDASLAWSLLWYIPYWVTFVLAWVVAPVWQAAETSGGFTLREQIVLGITANLKWYAATVIVIAAVVVILVLTHSLTFTGLPDLAVSLSNTYGLLLVLLLAGHGLVELPRKLWRKADPSLQLKRHQFRAVYADEVAFDARCDWDDAVATGEAWLAAAATAVGQSTKLATAASTIQSVLHTELDPYTGPSSRPHVRVDEAVAKLTTSSPAGELYKHAQRTHAMLLVARASRRRSAATLLSIAHAAQYYQHVLDAQGSTASGPTMASLRADGHGLLSALRQRIVYLWHSKFAWAGYRVGAGFAALLSCVMLWSELMVPFMSLGTKPTLAPYAALAKLMGRDASSYSEVGLLVVCGLPLAYLTLVVYFAFFRVNFLGPAAVAPKRSDAAVLLANATYACRIQWSMAFHFLHTLSGTWGTALYATLAVGQQLTVVDRWLPLVLILLVAATALNMFERVLKAIGIDQADNPKLNDSDHLAKVQRGAAILRLENLRAGRARGAGVASSSHVLVSGASTPVEDDHTASLLGGRRGSNTKGLLV